MGRRKNLDEIKRLQPTMSDISQQSPIYRIAYHTFNARR